MQCITACSPKIGEVGGLHKRRGWITIDGSFAEEGSHPQVHDCNITRESSVECCKGPSDSAKADVQKLRKANGGFGYKQGILF